MFDRYSQAVVTHEFEFNRVEIVEIALMVGCNLQQI